MVDTYDNMEDFDWEIQAINPVSRSKVYTSESMKKAYIAFDAYKGSGAEDIKLTLRDIPLNRTKSIRNNEQFSDAAQTEIETQMKELSSKGYNIEFVGYSRGGYAATHWGTLFDIDTQTLNAHIMPTNEFPKIASSKIVHHTIVNDPVNFKYGIHSSNSTKTFEQGQHFVYPPGKGEIFTSDPMINHSVMGFLGRPNHEAGSVHYDNLPTVSGKFNMNFSSKTNKMSGNVIDAIGNITDIAGVAGATIDPIFDIVEHKYTKSAIEVAGTAAAVINPVAGQLFVTGMTGVEGFKEFKAHQYGRGTLHVLESGFEGAAVTGGPLTMMAVDEGFAAVDYGIASRDYRRNGDRTMAILSGIESGLLTAGAASTYVTGGLGGVLFGGMFAGVHLAERAILFNRDKETNNKRNNIPEQHTPPELDDLSRPDTHGDSIISDHRDSNSVQAPAGYRYISGNSTPLFKSS